MMDVSCVIVELQVGDGKAAKLQEPNTPCQSLGLSSVLWLTTSYPINSLLNLLY